MGVRSKCTNFYTSLNEATFWILATKGLTKGGQSYGCKSPVSTGVVANRRFILFRSKLELALRRFPLLGGGIWSNSKGTICHSNMLHYSF